MKEYIKQILELAKKGIIDKADVLRQLRIPSAELGFYYKDWFETAGPANHEKAKQLSLMLAFVKSPIPLPNERYRIIHVSPGDCFAKQSNHHYVIQAGNKEHYLKLLSALEIDFPHDKLYYVLDAWDLETQSDTNIQAHLSSSIFHLKNFTQALLEKQYNPIKLLHIYNEGNHLNTNYLNIGFMRALHQEHPGYNYSLVGLDQDISAASLSKIICDEFSLKYVTHVKYLKNKRYTAKYQKTLSRTIKSQKNLDVFRHGGAYLITGGFGGIGYIFAKHLAENFQARLILVGKSPENASQQAQINELRAFGADVQYASVDLGEHQEVANLFMRLHKDYSDLNGIIHAAGVIHDGFIINKSDLDFEAVLKPKVHASIYLDELSKDFKSLDFFAMFSSVALLGNAGQCDYSAASAFMDYFSSYRDRLVEQGERFGKSICINWSLWANGGMKIDELKKQYLYETFGMGLLTPQFGIGAFENCVLSDYSSLIVVVGSLQKFQAQLDRLLSTNVAVADQDSKPKPDQNTTLPAIQQQLKSTAVKILGHNTDKVSIYANLANLGLDSISMAEFAHIIGDAYKIPFTPAVFFQHMTIENVAKYILNNLPAGQFNNTHKKMPSKETAAKTHASEGNVQASRINHFPVGDPPLAANYNGDEIAIIGMSGVFPGANNLFELWDNLINSYDAITEFPLERADLLKAQHLINWGGFVKDMDKFDAAFFNISPYEAELMDPLQRVFLQTVCATIEDAGYPIEGLAGSACGLFVGTQLNEYANLIDKTDTYDSYVGTGNSHAILANRISYILDLHGPSIAIDTACSSALVAAHQAIQSIRSGESSFAIAGGINGLFTGSSFLCCMDAEMLSPDGRCKAFDANANGYVRAEGAGAIFLKPLSKAIADRDHVYGIIKSSAINHGGRSNSLTAPSTNAQKDLIKKALYQAQISPATITYIEAHGTGTALGDPVEINALKFAYDEFSKENELEIGNNYCGIGTIKTNIGHAETAAGVAGIIKILLSLQYQTLPANLHFKQLNPYIDLDNSPFYVLDTMRVWPELTDTNGTPIPRRAGISSFGLGGTNAHFIIEEMQTCIADEPEADTYYIFTLSAKNATAFVEQQRNLLYWLDGMLGDNQPLRSISYTLNLGRGHYNFRGAWVANSKDDLKNLLKLSLSGKSDNRIYINQITDSALEEGLGDDKVTDSITIEFQSQQSTNNPHYCKLLQDLANYYVKGHSINWARLYPSDAKRISLPTYPFRKDSYWIQTSAGNLIEEPTNTVKKAASSSVAEIQNQLSTLILHLLKIRPEDITPSANFVKYGFDSITYAKFSASILEHFQFECAPTIFYQYHNIQMLAEYIEQNTKPKLTSKNTATIHLNEKYNHKHENVSLKNAIKQKDIAIIGMAGVFPGAENINVLWTKLLQGFDAITHFPDNRHELNAAKDLINWGGFCENIDKFDAEFFGISPKEAELMDPQQRIFLQTAYSAIENAGYDPACLNSSNTAVLVGVGANDYFELLSHQDQVGGHVLTGTAHSILSNRVSYFLGLNGVSQSIDTACSSSLVAIAQAMNLIQNGDAELAIAGGVNALLSASSFIGCAKAGMLSPQGRCQAFSKLADGYVRSEGAGAVVLKSLDKAQADSDYIYAIIKSAAMNHGGNVNSLTAPNPNAQAKLIVTACQKAAMNPNSITYIETHGTGTSLGDPIEINGLGKAFDELSYKFSDKLDTHYCGIGSIKSNIGHLETAAGIASVIKVVLAMQHHYLPASIHCDTVNPYIQLDQSPFYIVKQAQEWKGKVDVNGVPQPLVAGISSFGFGGTNAHIILKEHIRDPHNSPVKPYYLIKLSARSAYALLQKQHDLLDWLSNQQNADLSLASISYTCNVGRSDFNFRGVWLARSIDEFVRLLQHSTKNENHENIFCGTVQSCLPNSDLLIYETLFTDHLLHLEHWSDNEELSNYVKSLRLIASLYVKGYNLDWNKVHKNETCNRIPLPTYPFAKKRYWIPFESEVDKQPVASRPRQISKDNRAVVPMSLAYYRPCWEEANLSTAVSKPLSSSSKIVAFVSKDAIFSIHAEQYIIVEAGATYQQFAPNHYQIRAGFRDDYMRLFASLTDTYQANTWQIVNTWSLTDRAINDNDLEEWLLHEKNYGISHLLGLSQALLAHKIKSVRLLHLFSYHAGKLTLEEMNSSFIKTIQEEQPGYVYSLIGLDAIKVTEDLNALNGLFLQELAIHKPGYIQYVDGKRYERNFTQLDISNLPSAVAPVKLRRGGVYLITGGLGGLGFIFASYLARHYQTRLLLTGRSALDAEKQAKISVLEGLGAKVHYVATDVSERDSVQQLMAECKERFNQLHGILHAAGLADRNFIQEEDIETIDKLSRAKISASIYLDEYSVDQPLDFMLLFSSISTFLMNASLTAYGSVNAFLNSFADYREYLVEQGQRRGRTISINWPLWAEGGMQIDQAAQEMLRITYGMNLLSTEQGLAAFEQALATPYTQILPIFGEQQLFYKILQNSIQSKFQETKQGLDKLNHDVKAGMQDDLQIKIVDFAATTLKLEPNNISTSSDFTSYGFDSINLTELANKLNEAYQIRITPALLYQYSSVEKLSAYIIKEYANEMVKSYGDDYATNHVIENNVTHLHPAADLQLLPDKNLCQPMQHAIPTFDDEIAIIGMSGIFPGANNVQELWNNLMLGKDVITQIPENRVELQQAKKWINWGGFVEDMDKFDAAFFKISPREAELMDPQQRVFLQLVCSAIEDAGYGINAFSGKRCGVFVGAKLNDYAQIIQESNEYDGYVCTGNSPSILANRVSFLFNLLGPSEAIDTACSSALVAIHRAVQSLRSSESELAIAGGINGLFCASGFINCAEANMLSKDGRCKSFDADANGYVRSEGGGVIILKKLRRAIDDGDHVYGVIKGTGVNHGGHVNTLTAPNADAQAELITSVYRNAKIAPNSISYIETHGTGTKLGDPIEINALKKAFEVLAEENQCVLDNKYCALGAVKSNVGHLETAAGIVGVIKVLLALQNNKIPQNINFNTQNPYLDIDKSPFYLATVAHPWERVIPNDNKILKRRAGISAFGFGGVNAHIVIEEL